MRAGAYLPVPAVPIYFLPTFAFNFVNRVSPLAAQGIEHLLLGVTDAGAPGGGIGEHNQRVLTATN